MAFTPGSKHGQMADINMTPLIDVMLVLLIIFMVSAPMLSTGMDVSLPETRRGQSLENEGIFVTLVGDGRIQFEKKFLTEGQLRAELRKRMGERTRKLPVMIRADQNLPYRSVVAVMDVAREAGFTQVGLVTQGVAGPAPERVP